MKPFNSVENRLYHLASFLGVCFPHLITPTLLSKRWWYLFYKKYVPNVRESVKKDHVLYIRSEEGPLIQLNLLQIVKEVSHV